MFRRKPKTMAAHPGEILRTEFMQPMGITAYQRAKALHFPGIYEVVREERAISANLALRLGKLVVQSLCVSDSAALRSGNESSRARS